MYKRTKQNFAIILLGGFATIYFSMGLLGFKLGVNLTDSLDYKLFIIREREAHSLNIAREDLVVFQKKNRFFGETPFVKIVAGIAGDIISIKSDRQVYVNDKFIGKAVTSFKDGSKPVIIRAQTIPDKKFFAYTNHERSYDSRYEEIGLISIDDIYGFAYPIL